jgi:hypothetical protein
MSQKIYTRQVKMLRPQNRAVTAEDIKGAAQKDLQPGEQLIRVAFVAMEGDFLVIEAGYSGGKGPEPAPEKNLQPETKASKTPPPASAGFKAGQVRTLSPRSIQPKPNP